MFNWLFKKNIEQVLQKNKEELLKKKNVWSVATSKVKIKDGQTVKKDCIMVFVNKKEDMPFLMSEDVIPKEIDGVPTDVYDLGGEVKPMYKQKHRPLVGGISAIVEGGTACTLGLVVLKDGKKVALTNDHCVSFQGNNNVGKKYIQQSPADGGSEEVGKIISAPILRNDIVNKIDSAIVELSAESLHEVLNLPNYKQEWKEPGVGMKIIKIGRTTGRTEGAISNINVEANVNYGGNLGLCKVFPTIFVLQNNYDIVNGGDSGSCIFSEDGYLVGQTFAAAPNLAIFMPIRSVIEELGIELKEKQEGYVALERTFITDKEVLVDGLNFRSSPEISTNIIKKLYKGTIIEVVGYAGFKSSYHWLKIKV